KNKVRERTSTAQPLDLEGSEPDFARRRTAAQLPSFVRRVHPPEGCVSQEIDEIPCERTKSECISRRVLVCVVEMAVVSCDITKGPF
ncbi:MAG TPA: hypothetical protein DCM49_07600, partial [Lachnospiraceae bacterium]|nr:hypothetical protein [Lachnospiraceae bacterium]